MPVNTDRGTLTESFAPFPDDLPPLAAPKELVWDAEVSLCLENHKLIWEEVLDRPAAPSTTAQDKAIEEFKATSAVTSQAPADLLELAELVRLRAEVQRLATHSRQLDDARRAAADGLAQQQRDFDNYRVRVQRERDNLREHITCEIVKQFLPLMDNLTRALATQQGALSTNAEMRFVQGISLIAGQIEEMLANLGVTPVVGLGTPFDPAVHEAVALDAGTPFPPNTVTEELQRGYQLGSRLIRAAIVKVSVNS